MTISYELSLGILSDLLFFASTVILAVISIQLGRVMIRFKVKYLSLRVSSIAGTLFVTAGLLVLLSDLFFGLEVRSTLITAAHIAFTVPLLILAYALFVWYEMLKQAGS